MAIPPGIAAQTSLRQVDVTRMAGYGAALCGFCTFRWLQSQV